MKSEQKKQRGVLRWLRRKHKEHEEHEAGCTSLCCARSGETLCVQHLVGEVREAACLRDIGLREGAVVTVVRHGDPLLVRIGDARFGIGRAAAERILCNLPAEEDSSTKKNSALKASAADASTSSVSAPVVPLSITHAENS